MQPLREIARGAFVVVALLCVALSPLISAGARFGELTQSKWRISVAVVCCYTGMAVLCCQIGRPRERPHYLLAFCFQAARTAAVSALGVVLSPRILYSFPGVFPIHVAPLVLVNEARKPGQGPLSAKFVLGVAAGLTFRFVARADTAECAKETAVDVLAMAVAVGVTEFGAATRTLAPAGPARPVTRNLKTRAEIAAAQQALEEQRERETHNQIYE